MTETETDVSGQGGERDAAHEQCCHEWGDCDVKNPLVVLYRREDVALAWFDGYEKGNLDGYFGTSNERTKSPYADLDPYRETSVTPPEPHGGTQ